MPSPDDDVIDDPFAGEDSTGETVDDVIDDPFPDDDAEPDLVAETQAELGDIGDLGAGALDGLLMNYAGEIGEIGEGLGNLASGAPWDADGANPFDDAQETSLGTVGNIAGNVASGAALGLATGGVGGIAAQAGIQGGAGAVAGYGANHDPYEALMGGGIGALFGGAGRAIAGKAVPAVHQMDDVLPRVHSPAGEYAPIMVPGELQSAAGEFAEKAGKPLPPTWSEGPGTLSVEQAAKKSARDQILGANEAGWLKQFGAKALDMVGGNPLRSPGIWALAQGAKKLLPSGKMGTMARPDEQAVKNIMGSVGGASALTGERLQARPDLPTLVWGMQSLNASGDTGLPQKAQERLDAALASGDDSNVSSVYMSLSMAHPGFQRRMQREIESINDESE